jgi:CO dehydrogenase maturation factor
MSYLIAVSGKGGTGKTTVSACLVRLLLDGGVRPILVVDADPNSTLAPLLGAESGATISDIRREVLESKSEVTAIPKGRMLDLKLAECLQEGRGFDLLTMGRPEGAACYCYVNNLVRHALASLRANYRVTVVDNEAGMEHLSRMNTDAIDCLVVVCEPTLVSVRAVSRIFDLSAGLPVRVKRKVLVWNKVAPAGVPEKVGAALADKSFDAVIVLPWDETVGQLAGFEENVLAGAALPAAFGTLVGACGIMGGAKTIDSAV